MIGFLRADKSAMGTINRPLQRLRRPDGYLHCVASGRRDLKGITPRLHYASLVANARRDLKGITPRLHYASLVANARRGVIK